MATSVASDGIALMSVNGLSQRQQQQQDDQPAKQQSKRQKLSRQERLELKRRERRRRRLRQTKTFCKKFFAFVFSHIGLSGLIVAYTFVGGLIFQAIEMPQERELKQRVRIQQNDWEEELVRLLYPDELVALADDPLEATFFNATAPLPLTTTRPPLTPEQLKLRVRVNETVARIIANVTRLVKDEGWNGSLSERDYTWNFPGALLFVVTVITTIGYGHAAPKTWLGMIATMLCAFLGIPLMFLYLNNIGDYLADGFRLLYSTMCRPYLKKFRLCNTGQQQGPAELATAAAAASSTAVTGNSIGGLRSSLERGAYDIIRMKTDFARPLVAAWPHHSQTPSPMDAEPIRPRSGTIRVIFDSSPPDQASLHTADPRARRALATARLLPATRQIRRSLSTPSPGSRPQRPATATMPTSLSLGPGSLLQHGVSSARAPVVDWANIDEDLIESEPLSITPLPEEITDIELNAVAEEGQYKTKANGGWGAANHVRLTSPSTDEPLARTISYISMPSPTNSTASNSLSEEEWSDVSGGDGDPTVGSSSRGSQVRRIRSRRHPPQDKKFRQVTVPLSLSLALMLGYVTFGSFLFTIWEQRDYIKWSYFCFITLSTIGFGDIVPGTEVDSQNPKEKLIATTLYVAVGLSVFAMCFKLMQEEAVEKVRRLGRRLGVIARRKAQPQQQPPPLPAATRRRRKKAGSGSAGQRH